MNQFFIRTLLMKMNRETANKTSGFRLYEIELFTENCLLIDEGKKRCIVD